MYAEHEAAKYRGELVDADWPPLPYPGITSVLLSLMPRYPLLPARVQNRTPKTAPSQYAHLARQMWPRMLDANVLADTAAALERLLSAPDGWQPNTLLGDGLAITWLKNQQWIETRTVRLGESAFSGQRSEYRVTDAGRALASGKGAA